MLGRGESPGGFRPIDFFVSYSPADERWATWIAWQLEAAGYRTMLQAWDFVPGTNFIDFMDRGVSEASVVVAVLSRSYLGSRYGRLEWQAALRSDPDDVATKLVTIRVEDCPLEGLLSMITYVDLVGVTDPDFARGLLLGRIRQALAGRAKPTGQPSFPSNGETPARQVEAGRHDPAPSRQVTRRAPVTAPVYPPAVPTAGTSREAVTVLHVTGPRFGRGLAEAGAPLTAVDLQARIWSDLTRLTNEGAPAPDLILVTGDLTESGSPRQFGEATEFLTGLRMLLALEPHRLVVVPGPHDLTRPACQAYFASCEADDVEPRPPYWPKWRHFSRMFDEIYRGLDAPLFDDQQPWTLFDMPDLQVVVAGVNSTMADSHREEDHYGWVGEAQAAWFAKRLRPFEDAGWLRLAAVAHPPGGPDTPPGDRAAVRDGATLRRLVAPRVNLLVHGGATAAGTAAPVALDLPDAGLATVPPTGRHQLLRIAPDGVSRWTAETTGPGGVERVTRRWRAVSCTFASAAGGPRAGTDAPPALDGPAADDTDGWGAAADRSADPARMLLDRVAEVCQTRYERARIRRVDGEPPFLRVTYLDDGFVRQSRVAAHVGEVRREELEAFLATVHATDPESMSELVYQGPAPGQALRDEALRRGVRLRSFVEFQGLVDLREFVDAQTARLRSDRRYPPELYVPQRYRDLVGSGMDARDGLTEELLRHVAADDGRFVLVLGDFGRGKTFALREVARRIPTELPHLIPILIDLRSLDKVHSVDGLVAAHLANHGEELIDLRAFRYMLRQGRIVLLFDGFDELVTRVTYDRAADHLDTLLHAAEDRAKVVVASRTQHFRSDEQVFTALGERVGLLPHRRVLSIEDFSPAQIRTFLVNRNAGDEQAAEARFALIRQIQDLSGLARNPRMLSFIAQLDEERLAAVAGAGGAISAAGLYREILRDWLAHEEERTGGQRGAASGLTAEELWKSVTVLAIRLWETDETFLRASDLQAIADTLTGLADGHLSSAQTAHAVGTGSLLVRTEDGLFGFIHGSVVEWLVANEIADQLDGGVPDPLLLSYRPLTQLTVDFLCDLADPRLCQPWVRRVLADPGGSDVRRSNALKIATRLRTPTWTDLRGASLQGEDLSYRDLRRVDLSGADLTDARLVGTNLTGAVLRDARLVRARLDEAVLAGADLSGADLTGARLPKADLSGAVVTGSRWRRAALVGVTGGDALRARAESRGAAFVPGRPVETGLAPSSVGVSCGFEIGRIPDPISYSADGTTLAVGEDDGGVLVCDAVSGLPLRRLQGHRGRVYAVAYAPVGHVLATAASDCAVCLWDSDTGRPLRRLTGHQEWVWPVAAGPDGTLLATGDAGGTVRLWDVAAGSPRHELPGHATRVWTAAFAPDGTLLATGDSDGVLRIWDTATGTLRHRLDRHTGSLYRLAWTPDGSAVATTEHGGMVRLWDAATGALRHEMPGHGAPVYTVDVHPDGTLVATGDTKGVVRLWNTATGRGRQVLTGHTGAVYGVHFGPDGSLLASGDSDGVVRLWDTATGAVRHELTLHRSSVWPITFRPDGVHLATSANDGTVRLWDTATGQCRNVLRGHGRRIMAVQFNADGSLLATSGNDGVVRLWNPRTGERRRELRGIADRLVSAVWSPVGDILATGSNDGGVYLWDAGTGAFERELNIETDHVWAETFSPNGDVLATANDDDTVRLWYRTTGRRVLTLAEHRGRVRSMAFSPDGATLATGCDDWVVRLWDSRTGERLAELSRHVDRVFSVRFSHDGSLLASAGNDGTACLWDPRTGALLRDVSGHAGRLWSVAFHPGGEVFATAGDDMVVRLWECRTGRHVASLSGHSRRVWSVDFSPDGATLASGGDDGTVRLWDVTDVGEPRLRMTLLGLPDGWAALSPDGRYKCDGEVAGQFWNVVDMCRFEAGELEPYLPEVRRVPVDARF